MAVPFDVAADFLDVLGLPGDAESPLTLVTVRQMDPDEGTVLVTAANVVALKRKRALEAPAAGGGEVSSERCSFRLWASYLSFAPDVRDRITDADGVTWKIDAMVSVEGFGGFYLADPCTRVRE